MQSFSWSFFVFWGSQSDWFLEFHILKFIFLNCTCNSYKKGIKTSEDNTELSLKECKGNLIMECSNPFQDGRVLFWIKEEISYLNWNPLEISNWNWHGTGTCFRRNKIKMVKDQCANHSIIVIIINSKALKYRCTHILYIHIHTANICIEYSHTIRIYMCVRIYIYTHTIHKFSVTVCVHVYRERSIMKLE